MPYFMRGASDPRDVVESALQRDWTHLLLSLKRRLENSSGAERLPSTGGDRARPGDDASESQVISSWST
jgi:hypothetical protein